jgi:cytochrome oxidase assembly protein ShyY1
MYRFLLAPKWLAFHLVVLVAIVAMVWLGFWQLRRLDERQAFNATVEARIDEPPVSLDELPLDDPAALEWRQVTFEGDWLGEQIVWFNRSQDGVAGDNLLAPLAGSSTTVIVNRGFVALGDPAPPAPTGAVEVLGRVRVPAGRQLGELTDAADGPLTEVRRIDLERLDAQIPGDLAPVYLDLIGSIPNVTAADPVPVPPPVLGEGPHLSYAMQWFIFAAAVATGWALAVRRSMATRRRAAERLERQAGDDELSGERGEPAESGSSSSGDGVPATTPT